MTDVTLVPMTADDLDAFVREEIADCADERVLDGTWERCEALDRAQTQLLTVVAWERQAAAAERQRLLTAITPAGTPVGWLWVKLAPPGPRSGTAFLCQMTVARAYRRQWYGWAMLAALEALLADEGISEIHLNVNESNLPAKRLYTAAGYELAQQFATMRQLSKRLGGGHRAGEQLTPSLAAQAGRPARSMMSATSGGVSRGACWYESPSPEASTQRRQDRGRVEVTRCSSSK